MSARVQTSYLSTKPSKFGAVNESTNLSMSNHQNYIFPSNMKSWLQGFDTSRAFVQSQQNHIAFGDISDNKTNNRGRTDGLNTPMDRDYYSQNAINQSINFKQSMGQQQIGTAIAGQRKRQLLFNDTANNFNNQKSSNPKTAVGGQRKFHNLNRSIGNIPLSQEDQVLMGGQNHSNFMKLNMSTNLSNGFSQNDSNILPSVGNSQERDKQILFAKNRQIVSEQVSKLKSSTQKRRAISLLQGNQPANFQELNHDSKEKSQITNAPRGTVDIKQNHSFASNQNDLSRTDKLLSQVQHLVDSFPKISVDHRIIEQWLNDTLSDAEHYKLPGVILKVDHQNPITRYGIDRMTLTNAGIPNEEVNHLYRAMFVYSVGFFNLIRDITEKSKEVYLQSNEKQHRHVTKFSIVTAVWKVYQILLEYTYRSDYQLLINRIQENFKVEKEQREKEFEEILQDYKKTEYQLQLQIKNLQSDLATITQEKLQETQTRKRIEEELLKNQKTHEDEVTLRLKFEEKLNNLHALNRMTNQNLSSAKLELEHTTKVFTETQALNKQLNHELAQEKVKGSSFEQKYIYSQDKNHLLSSELTEKQKHNERLLSELSEYIDKYELFQYKFNTCEKDLQSERLQYDKQEVEFRHMKQMYEHFKRSFEESSQKNKIISDRLIDLQLTYQKCYDELSIYRQDHVGYETSTNQKGDIISELKSDIQARDEKVRELEEELSEWRAKHQIAEHELSTIKIDYDLAAQKVEKINKARNDAEMQLREKAQRIRQLEQKLHDRDEQIMRNQRKIHEMDEKILDMEKNNTQLEKDKATSRIEFEQIKRQQLDRIHSLEELIKNEKELRQSWCERYEKESKSLSAQNLELMDMKTRYSQMETKYKHMLVDNLNEKRVGEMLAKGKKEVMDTLNSYIVKCEMMEKDIYAMREVNKHFEYMKEQEQQDLRIMVEKQKKLIVNFQMGEEDFMSRLAWYTDTIMNQSSTILRINVQNGIYSNLVKELKESIEEKNDTIAEQSEKIKKLEDEAIMSKSSYKAIKVKLNAKEDEIYIQQREMKEVVEKLNQCKIKKRQAKQLRDQYEQEMKAIQMTKAQMQSKTVQVVLLQPPTVTQEIQCALISQNVSQSAIPVMNYIPQKPKNELEKYEQHKADKAKKKKDKRDQLIKTSKLQSEIHAKYDLSSSATKLMKASKQQQLQQQQINLNTNGLLSGGEPQSMRNSTSKITSNEQDMTRLQQNNSQANHSAHSSVNVVKHVNDLSRRMSDNYSNQQFMSNLQNQLQYSNNDLVSNNEGSNSIQSPLRSRFKHESALNVSGTNQFQNIDFTEMLNVEKTISDNQSSQQQSRQRGKSVMMKHSKVHLGVQQLNINNDLNQFPSTINQIMEGQEDYEEDSLQDEDGDTELKIENYSLQKDSLQKQQNTTQNIQEQLREIEQSQALITDLRQKEQYLQLEQKDDAFSIQIPLRQSQIEKQQARLKQQQRSKSNNQGNQGDKQNIKSLLRNAFNGR
eukprot:403356266